MCRLLGEGLDNSSVFVKCVFFYVRFGRMNVVEVGGEVRNWKDGGVDLVVGEGGSFVECGFVWILGK